MKKETPNSPLPLARGDEILVVPMDGPPANDYVQLVMDLQREGLPATLGEAVPLPLSAYDPQRQQYRAERLLMVARELHGKRVLGVTGRDIFIEGMPFAFGIAESPGRAAVISLYRLREGATDETFRARVLKEAIHELGRTVGLARCVDPRCAMYPAGTLADVDARSSRLCGDCLLHANRRIRGNG
jgi:archaemetzincin